MALNPFPNFAANDFKHVFSKNRKISIIEWITYDKQWKTLWQKEKLLVLSNFFFRHNVFKNPFAAESSESVYMRERVNPN